MDFIKTVWKNKKMILKLGINDFKNKFARTSLGSLWGFIQPLVMMLTYAIVFEYILKVGESDGKPFAVWYFPAMTMWLFINDSINNVSNSIVAYSYLVKKIVFPVDTIPVISLISTSINSIFLIVVTFVICAIYGVFPNVLVAIYFIICAVCFLVGVTRFTSAVATLVPDFSQLITVIMQLAFWFTPIIWNISMVEGYANGLIANLIKCLPFSYLVMGFRQAFVGGDILTEKHALYTIIFWIITILIFLWSNSVFKRCKKDFADVL